MKRPFFSVITVTKNAGEGLKKTVDSVLKETFCDYEMIIKDGGSKDGSLDNIGSDERIKVVSSNDYSIYDAMNQAIKKAKGEYLLFLNAGDTLYSEGVFKRVKDFIESEKCDIIYGNCFTRGKILKQTDAIDKKYLTYVGGLCHQTMFIKRSVFGEIGDYDVSLRVCADYDILFRAFSHGKTIKKIDEVICNYLGGGFSESAEGIKACKKEGKIIRKRYLSRGEYARYKITDIFGKLKRRVFGK